VSEAGKLATILAVDFIGYFCLMGERDAAARTVNVDRALVRRTAGRGSKHEAVWQEKSMSPSDQCDGEIRARSGIRTRLLVRSLSAEAFRPYGDVLDTSGRPTGVANAGAAEVHRDIAAIDVSAQGGRVCVSVVRIRASPPPLRIEVMERHPLGSQAISPLGDASMLVVVAPEGRLDSTKIVAFQASPRQGVNYRRNVWHHPLIALNRESDFVVIDRAGDGENLILERLAEPLDVSFQG
jgi:ureidoglycolate lyase